MDEPDIEKSDGRFVFEANGDVLVVWDVMTGEVVTT